MCLAQSVAHQECAPSVLSAQQALIQYLTEVKGLPLRQAQLQVMDEFADYTNDALEELWQREFEFTEMEAGLSAAMQTVESAVVT
jgi:hypothetical protein